MRDGEIPHGLLRKQAALATQNAARQSLVLILSEVWAMESTTEGHVHDGDALRADPSRLLELDLKGVSRIINEHISWDQGIAEVYASLNGLDDFGQRVEQGGGAKTVGERSECGIVEHEICLVAQPTAEELDDEATIRERYGLGALLSPRKR